MLLWVDEGAPLARVCMCVCACVRVRVCVRTKQDNRGSTRVGPGVDYGVLSCPACQGSGVAVGQWAIGPRPPVGVLGIKLLQSCRYCRCWSVHVQHVDVHPL